MWIWSLLLHHRKKLNILTPQLSIYYIQSQDAKARLAQIPEAATVRVLWKKKFFKILQSSQERPVIFAKFLRTPFLLNNSGRLLLKCGHCKNEVREIDCLCCRELDDAYCFGQNSRAQGKHVTIQLLWASPQQLVTCISLICPINEFFFWFLVQPN